MCLLLQNVVTLHAPKEYLQLHYYLSIAVGCQIQTNLGIHVSSDTGQLH